MEQKTPPLYPLSFEPIYKQKVWGGRAFQNQLGRTLPGDQSVRIGESWELADITESSPSGGGGGPERSVIAHGPLKNLTLHEVIQRYGDRLMGRLKTTPDGQFPLLVKFLDARENLSVQVHPDAAYVRSHPEAHLKSEAWYVVDAQPGAVIYKGIREGVGVDEFRQAMVDGTVQRCLVEVPVKAGDCHYLPSGTCHALGAGALIAEVQTPSDTTFRVWDWGRTDRQLHTAEALECMRFGPPDVKRSEQRSHIAGMFTHVARLVTCEHFHLEKVRMSEGYEQQLPYDQPAVWVVLEGGGRLSTTDHAFEPVRFERGQTLLIPAGLDHTSVALDHDTAWLEITFPQAMAQTIA